MEFNKWLEELKEKSGRLVQVGKKGLKKMGLERRISKLHCRLGERIDYLERIGRSFDEDEIVRGFIEEIRAIEREMEALEEEEGGDTSD